MRQLTLAIMVIVPLVLASGQDYTRTDVFGGYSLERIAICGHTNNACGLQSGDLPPTATLNGWEGAPSLYFSQRLGITADFAQHFVKLPSGASTSRFSYVFGPTLVVPKERVRPFLHLLAGGVHEGVFNSNGFNLVVGGGLDYGVARHLAIRLAQFDYDFATVPKTSSNAASASANGFRYAAGIVIK